jgi:N-acetylneuraminic acid mutarotase
VIESSLRIRSRRREEAEVCSYRWNFRFLTSAVAAVCWICLAFQLRATSPELKWKQLPSIPDQIGFAGCFAGVSGGALLVAGGANYPTAMPWDGGKKVWYDSVYVLPEPEGHWLSGFKLPHPVAYGVSVSANNSVICAGGSDAQQHYRDVFFLSWRKGNIRIEPLPPLPGPMAYGTGALVNNTFYVAGGTSTLDATNCLKKFWALDLAASHPRWRELPPWPGPSRMLAVAAAFKDSFFIFGGAELTGDSQGKPVRHYLKDAYGYKPGSGWHRVADLPRACAAAPSPAISFRGKLLMVSGDDGEFPNPQANPGFPKTVFAYDPRKDEWQRWNDAPIARATAPVTVWNDMAVVCSGEVRPGRRTPEVRGMTLR